MQVTFDERSAPELLTTLQDVFAEVEGKGGEWKPEARGAEGAEMLAQRVHDFCQVLKYPVPADVYVEPGSIIPCTARNARAFAVVVWTIRCSMLKRGEPTSPAPPCAPVNGAH